MLGFLGLFKVLKMDSEDRRYRSVDTDSAQHQNNRDHFCTVHVRLVKTTMNVVLCTFSLLGMRRSKFLDFFFRTGVVTEVIVALQNLFIIGNSLVGIPHLLFAPGYVEV